MIYLYYIKKIYNTQDAFSQIVAMHKKALQKGGSFHKGSRSLRGVSHLTNHFSIAKGAASNFAFEAAPFYAVMLKKINTVFRFCC